MEELSGVPLDKIIRTLPPEQLRYVGEQLKSVLEIIRRVKPDRKGTNGAPRLGSVSGGPYRNPFFPEKFDLKDSFTSVGEYLTYYRNILLLGCTERFTDSVMSLFPRNAAICFCHGDLFPRNIMVDPDTLTITGILDWELAGFYPEFFEYARMHDVMFMTPEWKIVLDAIFPGPKRQNEIDAWHNLVMALINCDFL